jgi:aminoglycoside phosphotransferase (APT) family kinase protein
MTFQVEMDQVHAILTKLDPSLRPASATRLNGGSQEVYRIDLIGVAEPIVLKIYADEPAWAPAKEALVSDWLTKWGELPVPRFLCVDDRQEILPLRYALMTWLPGETVRALKTEPDTEQLYREMGRWLKRLHSLPMEGYGYVLDHGIVQPSSTNSEFVATALDAAFRQFAEQGVDIAFVRQLESAARRRLPLADDSAGPFFAHDDFQPGNLLAVRDSGTLQLTGLIDFGNARAADPLFDLAKALFCSAHEDPRSKRYLLEGYGAIDHPEVEGVLWLYTLYHRVIMWTYLTRLGIAPASGPSDLLRELRAMI